MDIEVFSKIGNRDENQDYASYTQVNGCYCFVVCDGLGGSTSGKVASKEAVDIVLRKFIDNPIFSEENIESLTISAQQRVLDVAASKEEYANMMTTIAIVLLKDNEIISSHVGDTRVYVLSNKSETIVFQTKDHSLSQAMVNLGELDFEEIRGCDERNKLIRAIGIEPELFGYSINKIKNLEDVSLLICTDGFWNYIHEKQMSHFRLISTNNKMWLEMLNQELLSNTKNISTDNYTAIAVKI